MDKKQQVLIIEDSAVNRRMLVKFLGEEYEVLEASNGRDGLSLIEQKHDELVAVILDLRMPEMDGFELMARLFGKEAYANLPIVVATGESDPALESRCLEAGAWDFVSKPYNAPVIKLRLRNVIGRSRVYWLDQIKWMAERDQLTGLFNRKHFMEETKRMLLDNPDTTYALVRMDIDHFRLFNSSFGAEAGDELLMSIAEGIQQDIMEEATYGRIESDVFCLCVPYQPGVLEEHCRRSVETGRAMRSDFFLKLAFGIYVIVDPALDMEKMYSYATEAAHKCKHDLNVAYALYDESMEKNERLAQQITSEIKKAIEERQLEVYLQPKYSLFTKEPCGAEALIRWNHPENGLMMPGSFIPVIEKNGMIVQVDRYMWESVCQLLRRWLDEGRSLYPISVNVSRVSLYNPHLVDNLIELVDRYRVPVELLNLEITESAYMSDPDLMQRTIASLHDNGFVILMDDFGSGYSSLNTLKEIDVDVLKIDMKFLPAGNDDVKSEKILASVLRMANWLGLSVVVEGVETEIQKDFLVSIGCDYVQGYYFARPMPAVQYEGLISGTAPFADVPEPIKPSKDIDTLWTSDSKMGTLLRSVAVPFAVLEFSSGHADILRKNEAFSETFGSETQISKLLPSDQMTKLLLALDEVNENLANVECECLFAMPNSVGRWYRVRLSFIESTSSASLAGATFSDITTERLLERELDGFLASIGKNRSTRHELLIIDDSDISQDVLRTMFEEDFGIIQARDGREGLEMLEAHADRISLILLDMIMPVMNGLEFLAKKNALSCADDIPVVVISADAAEGSQINMLENGISDYVTKPFVPELVKKRVQNVLEYRTRFRNLLEEYRGAAPDALRSLSRAAGGPYTIRDVLTMLSLLSEVFDVARVVDPEETAVINFTLDGSMASVPYTCFRVWDKDRRCDNCSSMCAQRGSCVLTKFELIKSDIFYVVSRPIDIVLESGEQRSFVLEVVSHLSGQAAVPEDDRKNIFAVLEETHRQIYSDPLTGVFNRRYLDEMLFLHQGYNSVIKRIGFIVIDLYEFKEINDKYGHLFGDRVIVDVANQIRRHLRSVDSVVRMGGDEFVVTVAHCDEASLAETVKRLDTAVKSMSYVSHPEIKLQADFGYAYTDSFDPEGSSLPALLDQADRMMYRLKEDHRAADRRERQG